MEDRRFDALVRSLASGQNRRSVLKGLLGLGGLAAGAGLQATEAARRPTPTPAVPKCPGRQVWNGSACACPSGSAQCGAECCDTGVSVCCDHACCAGECYGEELCCPAGRVVCDGACCGADEQCCGRNGALTCVPANEPCCVTDADCRPFDYCAFPYGYPHDCVEGVCVVQFAWFCQGIDNCYTYGCSNEGAVHCTSEFIPGCCNEWNACEAVDACTPGLCLEGNVCNTESSCESPEVCCADGACSQNGSCERGPVLCTIDGVDFLPCVEGCPICLPGANGEPCGCAVPTETPCQSTAKCQELNTSWICAGGFCMYPLLPQDE